MKLKPIETAPRDGTSILVFGGTVNSELGDWEGTKNTGCVVMYNQGKWDVFYTEYYSLDIEGPTHWCELPEVPCY